MCFLYDSNGNTVEILSHSLDNVGTSSDEQSQWQSLCNSYFHNSTNSTFLKQKFAWDEKNRLRSIYTNSTHELYQYSDGYYRTAKNANDNGLVLYLDRTYQIKDGRPTKYYFAAGEIVAGKDSSMGVSETCNPSFPVHSPTCQYFFHSTSAQTNWVTDMVGKPIAYFTYLVNGEPWIQNIIDPNQAPANTGNLPIRPNGGELDESGYVFNGDYTDPALHLRL